MSSSRTDLILRQLDAVAPLPPSAARVLELAANPQTPPRQLQAALRKTQWLSRGVRRLAEVVAASGRARAGPPLARKAATRLEGSRLACAVAAASAMHLLGPEARPRTSNGIRQAELWKHCVTVGCAAEVLARQLARKGPAFRARRVDPLEAFCCGLLHDLGKMLLLECVPKSYVRVMEAADRLRGRITDAERAVIGLDHHEAGRRLAQQWRVGAPLKGVMRLHNNRPEVIKAMAESPQEARMIALVSLSDSLARSIGIGYSGNHTFGVPRELYLRRLGLTQADLDVAFDGLVDRVAARLLALDVTRTTARDLHRRTFVQTAADVTDARRRLEAYEQLGQARRRCFDELNALESSLDPSASVVEVLAMIGQGVAQAIDCGAIVTYGFDGDGAAQVVLLEPGRPGEFRHLSATHTPGKRAAIPLRPPPLSPQHDLIYPADEQLEWLTSLYSPRLADAPRWTMQLRSEGRVIGGLMWGGGKDETKRLSLQREALGPLLTGCALALRIAQVREEAARAAQQLSETNRRLAMAQDQIAQDRAVLCVAELAAGAAHEMNNPLMIISGRSQLLAQKLADERDRQAALAIHQNAQRLSDIITSLMRYARPDEADSQPIAVNDLLGRARGLLADLPEAQGREIDWVAPELPKVQADGVQIARALAALLENAMQATTAQGGRVEASAALDVPGENVVITIFDNGTGMDAVTLERAFDPFFSAKPAGRRRGMGLAVALRLIEANSGTLRLDSHLGAGTRAVLTLPVAKPAVAAVPEPVRKSA